MRQKCPKVSVIIPVYNTEKYLRECLDSVMNQTLKDIEVICVDDGSTDGSLAILREYEAKDSRVIVLSQENKGLSAARNAAMERAHGKYVDFVDSDDSILPDLLEKTVTLAEDQALDIVAFDNEIIFEREGLRKLSFCDMDEFTPVETGTAYLKRAKNMHTLFIPGWSKLVRRGLLEENKICFPEGIIHEDELYTLLIYIHAKRVTQIPKKLYRRRVREDSIMTTPVSGKNVLGYFGCALGLLEYVFRGPYAPETEEEIWLFFRHLINCTRHTYRDISEDQRKKISFSAQRDAALFQMLITEYFTADKSHHDEKRKLQAELEQQKQRVNILQKELDCEIKKTSSLRYDLDRKEKETDTLRHDLEEQKKQADTLQHALDCVHNSVSFRIGRGITCLPRKLRDLSIGAGKAKPDK